MAEHLLNLTQITVYIFETTQTPAKNLVECV